ncbi:PRELI domain-containing protein 1, mitochondrial-like isoform X2 [Polyodon spathula]|uniref:PRELI domain-containing protein 1, mitochondrial-like isoform X2 n=1 Tax=Polyodon spathula TaxID=7913 RepID=UPI001B7EF89C|nr:PRELI domain-containing protein 1, mitochondrial-like isoform X2 [Polyodon spathula]
MVKYFFSQSDIRSSWEHVFSAFWQRYPNPFSKHVLTEDVVFRKVMPDDTLFSRRLLTKTNHLPRWAEKIFPSNLARSVFVIEDSIVDPKNKTLTTFSWNINHTKLMVVEERCVYSVSQEKQAWSQAKREAWISSGVFGFSRAIQEFGLARFKSNQVKAMRGLDYALSTLHGGGPSRPLKASAKDAAEKAKETALATSAKNLASAASPQKPNQFV